MKQYTRGTYRKVEHNCIYCNDIFEGTKGAKYCHKCRPNSSRLKKKLTIEYTEGMI